MQQQDSIQVVPSCGSSGSYYSFSPHPHYRFIVMDGYDVSLLGWPEGHPLHQAAVDILDQHNPNKVKHASGLFHGVHIHQCCGFTPP